MGMPAEKRQGKYTYGDYLKWSEDDHWELIDGIVRSMSPAPGRFHQVISKRLMWQIENHVIGMECLPYAAPFDVVFLDSVDQDEAAATTVVQPDISVICDKSKLTENGCTGPPDWIIEIVSPYTSRRDFIEKLHLYERHGIREYWIIDPGNAYAHIYVAAEEGSYPADPILVLRNGTADCHVLKGLRIQMQKLFAPE